MTSAIVQNIGQEIIYAIRVEDGIFWFDLTEAIVSGIQKIQIQQSPDTLVLTVPRTLRRWLRKASVFDISEETAKASSRSQHFSQPCSPKYRQNHSGLLPPVPPLPRIEQSGMTFITRYPIAGASAREHVCILETIVSLDGDILNKVQRQFLDSAEAQAVSAAHFWLIDQLLIALRQETDWLLKGMTWFISGLPVGGILVLQTLQHNGSLEITDAIGPIVGGGFSSLIYSVKDYWSPQVHALVSRWGWNFVKKYLLKKQLGFSG